MKTPRPIPQGPKSVRSSSTFASDTELVARQRLQRTSVGAEVRNVRVIVVDDDGFTRMLLCSTVRELGHEVAAEEADVTSAMDAARQTRPDTAIVDLDFGRGPSGIDLAHGLRTLLPRIGIVILTGYADPRLLGHSGELPAASVYLVKRSVQDQTVLDAALHISVDPRSSSYLEALPQKESIGRKRRLSDSQIQIMRLVADGFTNTEIAKRQHVAVSTVEKSISRLADQLGIQVSPQVNHRVLITQAYFRLAGAR